MILSVIDRNSDWCVHSCPIGVKNNEALGVVSYMLLVIDVTIAPFTSVSYHLNLGSSLACSHRDVGRWSTSGTISTHRTDATYRSYRDPRICMALWLAIRSLVVV